MYSNVFSALLVCQFSNRLQMLNLMSYFKLFDPTFFSGLFLTPNQTVQIASN